jgi:hypothetical protein
LDYRCEPPCPAPIIFYFNFLFRDNYTEPGMVVHSCNPSIAEYKVGGFGVQGQPGLHSETLSQKKKKSLWLMPIILSIWEANIRKIASPGQKQSKTLSQK